MAVIEDNLKDIYDRQYRAGVEWPLLKKLVEDVEEIKEGGSGGGGGTPESNIEYVKIEFLPEGYVSDMTGKEITDAFNAGKQLVAWMGYVNSAEDFARNYYPLQSAQFYRGNFSIVFGSVIMPSGSDSPLTVRSFNAFVDYTDDKVTFNQVEKIVE